MALRAALTLFTLLVWVHRADKGLHRLLHRGAALWAFSAYFTAAFFVNGTTENGWRMGFYQRHLAFRTAISFFACYFRVHRTGITAVACNGVFGGFTGLKEEKSSQQE
ncbi:MAG: hypothetical protein Q7T20_08355 [Saprospiraceae bacterium]|nr:hypothetical protein [Saprospiraceae bacterium]